MNVKLLRNLGAADWGPRMKLPALEGQTVDVEESVGRDLVRIGLGVAVNVPPAPAQSTAAVPDVPVKQAEQQPTTEPQAVTPPTPPTPPAPPQQPQPTRQPHSKRGR